MTRRSVFARMVLLGVFTAFGAAPNGTLVAAEVLEEPITDFDREHWAFLPLERPPLPDVAGGGADVRNAIDRFINARLQQEKVNPLPAADRPTLLRRLKFDLLGLPPTPEEVSQFTDTDALRYEQLVDCFLASPRYGERWGQHWLDLARFAETDGFEHDKVRPEAWRYRDWVIGAFNEDMPYDRFIGLQIAGDELEPDNPDATLATAFCLSGPDMPDINSQEERRHNLLNELTATVGSVVMGLQLGCAQCHDHKYDPVSQADFYRMRAIFEPAVAVKKNESVFTLANSSVAQPSFVMLRGDYRRPGAPIQPGFVRVANSHGVALSNERQQGTVGRRVALAEWLTQPDHPLVARVIANRIWQQHFGRGLAPTSSDFGVMGEMPSHPELLDWLATELIRRRWSLKELHRLIVTSATYRRSSRWNVDHAITRSIIDSDPDNELLARFPRRRLEGEVVRDAMLQVSGVLNLDTGGPGVRPPLPPEMLKTLLHNQWEPTPDVEQHHRRSVYVFARRNLRLPIFDAFDRPDANASCARRNESTTATQSLLMMNSKLAVDVAERLATRCLAETNNNVETASTRAFLRCFGRNMDHAERRMIQQFLAAGVGRDSLFQLCLGLVNSSEFIYVD